jgi:hypothetical protein
MRIYLNVPYEEKDLAKRRGCRWDGIKKQWFIDDPLHVTLFLKWMPKHLLQPTLKNKKVKYRPFRKARTALNVSESRGKHGKV